MGRAGIQAENCCTDAASLSKVPTFLACFFITALTVWFWSPFFLVSSLIRFLKSLKFLHFLSRIAHEAISVVTSRKKSICSFSSSPFFSSSSLVSLSHYKHPVVLQKNREKTNRESVLQSKYFLLHIISVWEDERPIFFSDWGHSVSAHSFGFLMSSCWISLCVLQ